AARHGQRGRIGSARSPLAPPLVDCPLVLGRGGGLRRPVRHPAETLCGRGRPRPCPLSFRPPRRARSEHGTTEATMSRIGTISQVIGSTFHLLLRDGQLS